MVSKALNAGLRVWELFCALIVMALIGNMIASAFAGNPAIVNYTMFVAAFGMASLLYLLPTSLMGSFHIPMVAMGLDLLNVIFWFCAAVALPAYLHVHSCSNSDYTAHNSITNGSSDRKGRCQEAQASCAFLWFGWAAFVVSLFFSVVEGRGSGVSMRGPRRGGPSMSQV